MIFNIESSRRLGLPSFTFVNESGTQSGYEVVENDGKNWAIAFTKIGNITFSNLHQNLDIFLVSRGFNGSSSDQSTPARGGNGGNGGYYITKKNIAAQNGVSNQVYVGGTVSGGYVNSSFLGYASNNDGHKYGASGGKGCNRDGSETATVGGNGVYAFEESNTSIFAGKRFCAGGGGGGARNDTASVASSRGAAGGTTGGGNGGGYSSYSAGENKNATFYGGGGGGGFAWWGTVDEGGGNGYQGIVIIRNAR